MVPTLFSIKSIHLSIDFNVGCVKPENLNIAKSFNRVSLASRKKFSSVCFIVPTNICLIYCMQLKILNPSISMMKNKAKKGHLHSDLHNGILVTKNR